MRTNGGQIDAGEGSAEHDAERWVRSGMVALTGPRGGSGLGPPKPLVPLADDLAKRIASGSSSLGEEVRVDVLDLLAERAALTGLRRAGTTSCGGATRLLRAVDGWFAVSLARQDDVDLIPAWLGSLGCEVAATAWATNPWSAVAGAAASMSSAELVAPAVQLGLPVCSLGEPAAAPPPSARVDRTGVRHERIFRSGLRSALGRRDRPRVVDLSSLWAGPLCAALLGAAGSDVIKVESPQRPDGARDGPPEFFDLLNAGKRSVVLDLDESAGRDALRHLVKSADVVIEASRPRALEQLGIDARELLTVGPRIWVSITGHGRAPGARDRVAFGDDAAAAGGLVSWNGLPSFCGDAIADPLSGLAAAGAVLEHLVEDDGAWLIDVAMAEVARRAAGPTIPVGPSPVVGRPRARRPRGVAARLGRDTAEVLGEISR